MKYSFIHFCTFVSLVFSLPALGQNAADLIFHKVKSEVTINGTSNVKNFSCTAVEDYTENKKKVVTAQNPGVFTYKNATVYVPVVNFDCHFGMMTKVLKKALQSDKYPNIIIDFKKITLQGKTAMTMQNGDNIVADAELTIAGKSKAYKININNVGIKDGIVTFKGKLDIDMKDHDIEPPTVMGFIKVNRLLKIDFRLDFKV